MFPVGSLPFLHLRSGYYSGGPKQQEAALLSLPQNPVHLLPLHLVKETESGGLLV